ncbi:MAG: Gfo/Idh/MocA family oxidoreductase, partial [Oscillospiraceae bacterium]
MGKTKIAILGTGFISAVHIESITRFVQDAEVVAVCGRNAEHASALAERFGINSVYIDIDELLRESDAEIIDICLPNNLHRDACVKSANAGRHVIVEKPIAMTLEQADEMISTCENNGVLLMYAEELCFTPKYERVRELVSRGAVGEVYMLKQTEKHSGPHSAWFYDKTLAGGGVMMDMGCHSIAWCRHINGNNPIKTVYADMKTVCHGDITD